MTVSDNRKGTKTDDTHHVIALDGANGTRESIRQDIERIDISFELDNTIHDRHNGTRDNKSTQPKQEMIMIEWLGSLHASGSINNL